MQHYLLGIEFMGELNHLLTIVLMADSDGPFFLAKSAVEMYTSTCTLSKRFSYRKYRERLTNERKQDCKTGVKLEFAGFFTMGKELSLSNSSTA